MGGTGGAVYFRLANSELFDYFFVFSIQNSSLGDVVRWIGRKDDSDQDNVSYRNASLYKT
jgi:hypothetical protein